MSGRSKFSSTTDLMNARYADAGAVFATIRAEIPAENRIAYHHARRYNEQVDILSETFPVRLDEFKISPDEFAEDGVDAKILIARLEALSRFLALFREQAHVGTKR